MEELVEAMDHNFEGYDAIYRMVHDKTPKYGNDDDYADDLMQDVFYLYHDLITGRPTMRGGKYGVEMCIRDSLYTVLYVLDSRVCFDIRVDFVSKSFFV